MEKSITLYNGGIIIGIFLLLIAWAIDMKNYPPKDPKSHWPSYPKASVSKTYIPSQPYIPPKKTRHKCVYCNGRGLVKCLMCNGRGGKYINGYWSECISCNGTGLQACPICDGKGYTEY